MRQHVRPRALTASLVLVVTASLVAGGGWATAATAATAPVTYVVPAGQTAHESRPTLTGGGRYSYLNPTMDRAAANNQPNRARLLGEAYLGDGGATASYTIKRLSPTRLTLALWLYYSDDGRHPKGARDVDISIPELKWTYHWVNTPEDTKGWKAVKVATVTTGGPMTIRIRKSAATSAAFTLNAFALTNDAAVPPFAAPPPTVTYLVPAGQTAHESKPTLTGAGRYSYLNPTMDRAANNNQPNRANVKGEAYLGDGGATASYTIKKLGSTPVVMALWLHYSDDGKHPKGARDVDISIPELKWTYHWVNNPENTNGWKAAKVASVTTNGGITIRFRKSATTTAAFTLNAFALTSATTPPPFGYRVGPYDGTWTGTFKGTLNGQPMNGAVAATVKDTTISVTAPIKGTGTVSASGDVQVTGGLSAFGVTCTYRGRLVAPATGTTGGSVTSGTWACTGPFAGNGTWEATRR